MTEEHDAYKRAEFLGSFRPRAPHEQPGLLKCNFRAGITIYVASSPRRPSKVSLLKANLGESVLYDTSPVPHANLYAKWYGSNFLSCMALIMGFVLSHASKLELLC